MLAAAAACLCALRGLGGLSLSLSLSGIDASQTLRELRRLTASGDVAAADAYLRQSVGHAAFQAELSRTMSSRVRFPRPSPFSFLSPLASLSSSLSLFSLSDRAYHQLADCGRR